MNRDNTKLNNKTPSP